MSGEERMVWAPDGVVAYMFGEGFMAGEWLTAVDVEDYADDFLAKQRILHVEPHPDPKGGGSVLRSIPDETVPLVDYLQLSAQVHELETKVGHMIESFDVMAAMMLTMGQQMRAPYLAYGKSILDDDETP